jgi:hypothetical protein
MGERRCQVVVDKKFRERMEKKKKRKEELRFIKRAK